MERSSSIPEAATPVRWVAGELVLERTFPAPRARVFAAWTDAARFARWFGPLGSTLDPCRLDARPGGTLHYRHRFPDHEDVWVKGTFDEVRPPERLAFTCHFSDEAGGRRDRPGFPAAMRIEVDFADEGGGTRVVIRQAGLDADRGEVQGWTESLDRLAERLAAGASHEEESGRMTTGTEAAAEDREIVMERTFDAPRERVFDAWTDPAALAVWFGPRGFITTTHEADIRPGGVWRFTMHGPDGTDYSNRMLYREIERPARIVYEHGEDRDDDPARFHVTVTFEEEGGRTRQVSRMRFVSTEDRDARVRFGAVELGHQTMDKLAAWLAEGG